MPIHKISIVPTWSFRDQNGRELDPQLFMLLRQIEAQGKLTAAAKTAGISYRHAWNQLNKWADFFGSPLVELEKGRGAKLTPLGDKLLWAEKRVIARLEPQLDNITSELNIDLSRLLSGVRPSLRMHASHGYAVELLPQHVQDFELDLQYKNARDALASLTREQCDLAGFHLPLGQIGRQMSETHFRFLKPRAHRIIRFITRQQGLMVAPGNPLGVSNLHDLFGRGVRFINREPNSGTRLLLDALLAQEGLENSEQLEGGGTEFTHSAVAAHVASAMADAGFGVQAAASQFGLAFIPLAREHYLFVCHHRTLEQPACRNLIDLLSSNTFREAVHKLPGYDAEACGSVITVEELMDGLPG
ncbi:substrate-binding domain-containing protein [Marinobacterium litorale]|jgi:molybdate transport repressor ModE-like protein|uniref:helix-turn-helix transcriptional regulator n=1 Tax=Marinobacterium litorale TaxID=404770 RepID=UPI00041EDF13|nr:substrate-binding domain-containing protein [Marinobacterium litorale]